MTNPQRASDRRTERMISAQRYAFILDILHDRGVASIQHLSDRMGASFSTIRRDLDHLARKGTIQRTRGGATLPAGQASGLDADRAQQPPSDDALRDKVAMARAAAERVEDGQSVILSDGLTMLETARCIADRNPRVMVVTNSLSNATILARASRIRLMVLGGTLRPGTFTLLGEPGQSFIERLHVDLSIISVQTISDGLLIDSSVEVASMKQAMIAAARRVVLLADSWKFGGLGFCNVGSLRDVDEVITPDSLPSSERAKLTDLGIKPTYASPPPPS
jgi:DeoR family transcriptional regulator, aga operon transcriptional repressor